MHAIVVHRASISQAEVAGAEQACSAIAVVACAQWLSTLPNAHFDAEFCIRAGGALYGSWGRPRGEVYAHAAEMVQLASTALPIRVGQEHGGQMWQPHAADDFLRIPLREALAQLQAGTAAVLTCGVYSVALHLLGSDGQCEFFDSHSQPAQGNKAVLMQFTSRDALLTYLEQERFPNPRTEYTLCGVERRPLLQPRYFKTQGPALRAADALPPNGFLYVWPRDRSGDGTKEYAVAGLEDFWHHYSPLPTAHKTFYDLARSQRPVTFYADLEFDLVCLDRRNEGHADAMLEQLQQLVAAQWAEEKECLLATPFVVSDSSTNSVDAMEIEEQEEEQIGRVSFHLHNQSMWFGDALELGAFMQRVEQRAPPALFVWRKKSGAAVRAFFADPSVYSANRCFRLVGSTKFGQARPLRPLVAAGNGEQQLPHFMATLICPPSAKYYRRLFEEDQPPPHALSGAGSSNLSTVRSSSSSGGLFPLDGLDCPPSIAALAKVIEQHYKPQCMRGFQFAPTAVVTFAMVKHDCPNCNATHSNQCYVVADLKTRKHWLKCHKVKSKRGLEIAFPASLLLDFMADAQEMQSNGTFPAESSTAFTVLSFARAVFAECSAIPQPGTAPVRFHSGIYTAEPAPDSVCSKDGGTLHLEVTRKQVVIRCNGPQCKSGGGRTLRPSKSVGHWDLSFLFPPPPPLPSSALETVEVSAKVAVFLERGNFFAALGLDATRGAHSRVCFDLLHQFDEYAEQRMKADAQDELAARVLGKVETMRAVFGPKAMLLNRSYRECLAMAPDFCYPVGLFPRSPTTLLHALWMHLLRARGFKRVGDKCYVPTTTNEGHTYYRAVPLKHVMGTLCPYERAPNLCSAVQWGKGGRDEMRHALEDEVHFPNLPLSKRYLGFANVVYDLERNETVAWEQVLRDPSMIPFNCLANQQFPVEALAQAKRSCPRVTKRGRFDDGYDAQRFSPTPLLDGVLLDQGWTQDMLLWLYTLLGRMFHYVGKQTGDNWEIVPFLIGASGTFKSSLIALLERFLQPDQFGVIPTNVEPTYPIASLVGKLMVFMTECKGCNLNNQLFLQLATGDPVGITIKHVTSTNMNEWSTPMLFAGNGFLCVPDDRMGATERRCGVWPFTRTLAPGQGDAGLMNRIFETEGPLALIKWNTLYLAARAAIRGQIQSVLPREVREATHESIIAWDPLRMWLAQCCIIGDCLDWTCEGDRLFRAWCRNKGKVYAAVDWEDGAALAMLRRMGVTLDRQASPATVLVGIRLCDATRGDPPFCSVFESRPIAPRPPAPDPISEEEQDEQEDEEAVITTKRKRGG
jgi:hypothetical protein